MIFISQGRNCNKQYIMFLQLLKQSKETKQPIIVDNEIIKKYVIAKIHSYNFRFDEGMILTMDEAMQKGLVGQAFIYYMTLPRPNLINH